jgi:hypothetical protein
MCMLLLRGPQQCRPMFEDHPSRHSNKESDQVSVKLVPLQGAVLPEPWKLLT